MANLAIYGIPLDLFLKSHKICETKVREFSSFWMVEFFRDGWKLVKILDEYYALRQRGQWIYSFSPFKIVGDGEHDSLTEEIAIWRAAMACFCYSGNSTNGYRHYPNTLTQFQSDGSKLEKYVR